MTDIVRYMVHNNVEYNEIIKMTNYLFSLKYSSFPTTLITIPNIYIDGIIQTIFYSKLDTRIYVDKFMI